MAVAAVLFVRTDAEHRNATAANMTSLIENAYLAHHPKRVVVRFDPDGCFVSREWIEAFARLDIFLDSTARQAYHQLGDVGRTI